MKLAGKFLSILLIPCAAAFAQNPIGQYENDLPSFSSVSDSDPVRIIKNGASGKAAASEVRKITASKITDATVVGRNWITTASPNDITFPMVNEDNTITYLNASAFLAAIGAGSATVTIRETDGSPTIVFNILEVTNATLTDIGGGVARLSIGSGSGGGTWGSITGTLSSQTDLQSALDAKLSLTGNGAGLTGLTFSQLSGTATDAQIPNSITVDAANAGDSATDFFTSGQIERARGGTGADTSAFGSGLFGSDVSNATIDVDTIAEFSAALGLTGTPSSSTFMRGDGTWASPASGGGGDMLAANNLSDLLNFTTARANLGVAYGVNVLAPNGDGSALTGFTDAQIPATIARDAEVAAGYQPLDPDLTAIAALTTTAFGRGLLDDANATAARVTLGLVIGTDVLAPSGNGSALTGLTFSQLTGTATDAQIPNTITVDLATLATTATTATTADAGDSATAFFISGQIERARGGTGADTSGYGNSLLGSDVSNVTVDVDTLGEFSTAIGVTGSPSAANFLRGDGTWSAPAGGGTVTATGGNLTNNAIMLGANTTDSKVLGSLGTTTTVLHGNASGAPSFGPVSLTADVSGELPDGNIPSTIARDAEVSASYAPQARTLTMTGTANEINLDVGSQDLSANRVWTFSLSSTVDLGGKASFEVPNSAAPTPAVFGQIAGDNDAYAASRGTLVTYDGTAITRLVGVLASDTPVDGHVPTYTSGGTVLWQPVTATAPGSTNQIAYNVAGSLSAEAGFEYDPSTNILSVPSLSTANLNAAAFKVLDSVDESHGMMFQVPTNLTADRSFLVTGGFNVNQTYTADSTPTFPAGTTTLAHTTGPAGSMTVVASGFNGNLATTDDTVQEVAQKLDDLSVGAGSGDPILIGGTAVSDAAGVNLVVGNGLDLVLAGAAPQVATFDIDTSEFNGARSWGSGADASQVWTWDLTAGDPAITFGSGTVNVSTGALQVGGVAVLTSGGALGTPSSGTLTNATGLPISTGVSGLGTGVATALATPSSANLRTAVTDEVGTGSLMFTRTGVLRTVYINAGAMIPRTTNGAATGTTETTTNDLMFDSFDFDSTTSEGVGFWWTPPTTYNAGTVTVKFNWTAASGTGTVTWSAAARAFGDDDAMDAALGTAQAVTDTLLATGDMHVTATTSSLTIAGTPAANKPTYWQITRDVADTLSADAKLLGCTIEYTESATEPSAQ